MPTKSRAELEAACDAIVRHALAKPVDQQVPALLQWLLQELKDGNIVILERRPPAPDL